MQRVIDWFGKWLPYVWTFAWTLTITAVSIGVAAMAVKWMLSLVGVL